MFCHSLQCYHCLFKLKNKEEKLARKKIAPFMIWSKHDKNNWVNPYIVDRTSKTDTKLFLGLSLFYQYELFRPMLKGECRIRCNHQICPLNIGSIHYWPYVEVDGILKIITFIGTISFLTFFVGIYFRTFVHPPIGPILEYQDINRGLF